MEHHVRNFQTNEGDTREPKGDLALGFHARILREGLVGKGLREKSPEGCVSNFYGPAAPSFSLFLLRNRRAALVPVNPLSSAFVDRRTFRSH